MGDDRFMAHKRSGSAGDSLWRESGGSVRNGDAARRSGEWTRPENVDDIASAPGDGAPFRRVPNGTSVRQGPSHPAWEKPPSAFDYPRLRPGRTYTARRFTWPMIAAFLIVVAFVIVGGAAAWVFIFRGHGGAALASPSHSPAPTFVVLPTDAGTPGAVQSGDLASPTPEISAAPASPEMTYMQYVVQSGDTLTRIATKFGLKTYQLLDANPDLKANPDLLKAGKVITIPILVPLPTPTPTVAAP